MRLLLSLLLLAALPASAEVMRHYFHIQYGSGFFVSPDGYLLTNEHVVHGCREVVIKGPEYAETTAEVRATDPEHDLALIHAPQPPKGVAPLRENIEDLRQGDPVMLIGYPGTAWKTGDYKIGQASLVSMEGTAKHPEWIQFSDSAARGNSGGPLIDQSGNVIGVVVAMLFQEESTYEINHLSGEKTLMGTTKSKTDGAIGLATAEQFLRVQGVNFRVNPSLVILGDGAIRHMVGDYIVNVQCRIPISPQEAAMPMEEPMQQIEMQETDTP